MGYFNHILNLLLPDDLVHAGFELTDRRHRQHLLGFVFVALCMPVFDANMGQAGIGAIDQAQVSNYCPAPPNAVIAQPQMLFLFLDHHLNGPPLQIPADNFLHRQTHIICHQCNHGSVVAAFGEHHFDLAEFVHGPGSLNQFVPPGFPQSLNAVPMAGSLQQILAIGTEFVLPAVDGKPAVGLSHADITPVSLITGIDDCRTEIEGVEQNRHIKFLANGCVANHIAGQFGQLLKRDFKVFGMLFFNVEPTAQGMVTPR